jgi:hypothetical protein
MRRDRTGLPRSPKAPLVRKESARGELRRMLQFGTVPRMLQLCPSCPPDMEKPPVNGG